jgi:hypothetical protein
LFKDGRPQKIVAAAVSIVLAAFLFVEDAMLK